MHAGDGRRYVTSADFKHEQINLLPPRVRRACLCAPVPHDNDKRDNNKYHQAARTAAPNKPEHGRCQ
jgi:hypothetical protein